jgi:DNA-binding GntR family transcriptional regulator
MPPETSAAERLTPAQESVAQANADDERALVAAVLQRDRKAAAEFVERYADRVYSYVSRRRAPRSDLVDDVVQDVFL